MHGSVSGPITKSTSYFVSAFARNQQNENIVEAIDPASITATDLNGTSINEAFGNPSSRLDISPRIDLQLGKSNTLTIRETYNRGGEHKQHRVKWAHTAGTSHEQRQPGKRAATFGQLDVSKNLVDDIRFQYRRVRDQTLGNFESAFIHCSGTIFRRRQSRADNGRP